MPASQAGNVRALLVAIAPSSAPHIHTNLENFLLSKDSYMFLYEKSLILMLKTRMNNHLIYKK